MRSTSPYYAQHRGILRRRQWQAGCVVCGWRSGWIPNTELSVHKKRLERQTILMAAQAHYETAHPDAARQL